MATQKERPGSWKARGLEKRDFQHDHSGPEVIKGGSKKKGKGCKKNKGGPHAYTVSVITYYGPKHRRRVNACEFCTKQDWKTYRSEYLQVSTIYAAGRKIEREYWSSGYYW